MKEKFCVSPFIRHTQRALREGRSFRQLLTEIPSFQHRDKTTVLKVNKNARRYHRIGLSFLGLSSIAIYELARSKGMPLPDSNNLLLMLIPFASFTDDGEVADPGEPYDSGVEAYQKRHGTTDGFVDSLPDDEHKESFIQALMFWRSKNSDSQNDE